MFYAKGVQCDNERFHRSLYSPVKKSTPTAFIPIKRLKRPGNTNKMQLIKGSNVSTSIKAGVLVCRSGTFKCALTSTLTSEQHLLLPINLGRVLRTFLNNLKSIILLHERLFTSGKHSGQLPVFLGVNALANSQQGSSMQCSDKLQTTNLTLPKAQLAC